MRSNRLTSPCRYCPRWGKEMDECVTYCQSRRDFLHIAFGEPWHDTAALRKKHLKEGEMFSPGKHLDFSGPGPCARTFNCPICGDEVQTSHWAQKTCNSGECPKKYVRLADSLRKAKNRERNNARECQRKRERRMAGAVI